MARAKTTQKKKEKEVVYPCTACGKTYKKLGSFLNHAKTHKTRSIVLTTQDELDSLSIREELFVRYYVENPSTRGNQTKSYALAYGIDLDSYSKVPDEGMYQSEYEKQRKICAVEGGKLLTKPNIVAKKTFLLNQMLNDQYVDGELSRVIAQDDVTSTTKIQGIKEYNALKGRITKKEEIKLGVIGVVKHLYTKADEYDQQKKLEE
jgi:hypothetical protein